MLNETFSVIFKHRDSLTDPCEPLCPRHLMPVCGTDGQTYNNDCLLKAATCRDKSIVELHNGPCDPEKMEIAGKIKFDDSFLG